MEHALLNDESESGQELVGWQEARWCGGGGGGGSWNTGVETRAVSLGGGEAWVWPWPLLASPGLCPPPHPTCPAGVLKEIQSTLEGARG